MASRRAVYKESISNLDDNGFKLCMIWTARILLHSTFYRRSIQKIQHLNEDILEVFGLDEYHHSKRIAEVRKQIKEKLYALEDKRPKQSGVVYRNVSLLKKTFGLSDAERDILHFISASNVYPAMRSVVEPLNESPPDQILQVIAAATNYSLITVKKALSSDSPLGCSGLVQLVNPNPHYNDHPFKLIDPLIFTIQNSHDDSESLLAKCFRKSKSTALSLGDFSYLGKRLEILKRYLEKRIQSPKPGVNVLLYGAPGVGKTELARVMGKTLKASLYEVLVEDDEGAARTQQERLNSFRICQNLLKQKEKSLVLFDEVEDIFPVEPQSFFGPPRPSRGGNKGYMVNLLENNPVPTIWIANQIGQIDDAYLRRFDLLFDIKVPPRKIREKLLADKFSSLDVRPEWIDRISKADKITPSDVDRAAKILEAIGVDDAEVNEQLTEEVLKSNLGARRLSISSPQTGCHESTYDLSYLNTTENIARIAAGLAKKLKGNALLYGAPGTGKTAFAHHIGELANKPILIRRASDLLSMWVGGTEANIAKMFREAEAEQSILLLDEADSFFRDRRMAHNNWEVTQVNELLVQMESFSGLFVCSTNLMDDLDQAVFRRFALKIRFDYPTSEQCWRLFLAHAEELELMKQQEDMKQYRRLVERLTHLAPGDFAAVRRKHELLGNLTTVNDLINALADECRVKPDVRDEKMIGFQP